MSFPSRECNSFPALTWAGHSSPTRPGLGLSIVRGHPLLAGDSGSLLPPPSLPGEAVVHPSLPFSKSLMSTPTFCHSFLLTPRNRPRAPSFSVPKTYFTRRHTHNQAQSSTTALPPVSPLILAQARLAAPPMGELKEGR